MQKKRAFSYNCAKNSKGWIFNRGWAQGIQSFQVDFHFGSKQALVIGIFYIITILSRLIRVTFPKLGETKW